MGTKKHLGGERVEKMSSPAMSDFTVIWKKQEHNKKVIITLGGKHETQI